jgi:hypothetical protein
MAQGTPVKIAQRPPIYEPGKCGPAASPLAVSEIVTPKAIWSAAACCRVALGRWLAMWSIDTPG